eukprot:6175083-Pleurochrysis_carterae.AAC.1
MCFIDGMTWRSPRGVHWRHGDGLDKTRMSRMGVVVGRWTRGGREGVHVRVRRRVGEGLRVFPRRRECVVSVCVCVLACIYA